jgi:nucleoporin NUP42
MQTALSNVDEAINFIISAEKEHPNRIDICRMSTSGQGSTSTPFSQQSSTPTTQASGGGNPFGAPSQPAASSPFGTSTTASTGVFGQPSGLGQRPNPFGGTSQSFGTPSQLGAAGAFGRPSVLGQKPNPFGAPSASPASGISNTATAPFSSFAAAPNPFAQPQQQQGTNPFGAPSQPAQQNPLNQTATQISNPFGSANPPSQQQNPFGNPSSAPFGAPSSISENPFGQPSTRPPTIGGNPFGSASTSTVNPFAQRPPTQASTSNPFGATQPFAAPNANPFGNPPAANAFNANQAVGSSQPSLNGAATVGQNSSESYSSKGVDGRLKMFKGRPVVYKNDEAGFRGKDGSWQKIWFPQGAPAPYKDTEMEVSQYDESIKTAYMHLQQSGSFEGGVMPMMPPRREWCSFDF